jgi:hypothetical protein
LLTSTQVSSIFAQQQQMFAGMQAYSQNISAQLPQPYNGGIGAQGFGGGGPQYPSVPFAANQTAGFQYGSNFMTSYGPGNSVANASMSGMAGMVQGGMAAASMAGGLGLLGTPGRILDPFSMGATGWRAAGGMGMGLGGRVLGAAAGAAIPMAAMYAVGSSARDMVHGAQEQSNIERVLGQFQFQNAGSRTGRGFTRQDAMQIGGMVRQLAHIPEMLTSVGELSRIMDKMGAMGLMQGARDAHEFQRKFKDTLGTLKDIARVMGGSLEDALGSLGEARRSGFYSQGDVLKNAINRQVTGGLTGMNQGQVGALQAAGSQMGFATGGSRASGARHALRTASQLGLMNQVGLLSNDKIAELTGEEGAAGIQQLAGSLTEAGYRMSRSSLGTAMTLALGEVKDGRYTGQMDEEMSARFRRGEIGKSELLKIAHQKAQGRKAKISFAAQRDRLTSEMVGSVGAEGIAMEMSTILGERGWDNPDALNLVLQRYGVDERTASQVVAVGKAMGSRPGEMQARMQQQAKLSSRSAYVNENFSWEAIKKKISTKIENITTEPFKKMGIGIRDSIQNQVDSFIDDVTGQYSAELTQGAAGIIRTAAKGGKSARQLLAEAGAGSLSGTYMDIGRAGGGGISKFFARGINNMLGNQSAGARYMNTLERMGMGNLISSGGSAEQAMKAGNAVLSDPFFGPTRSISASGLAAAKSAADGLAGGAGALRAGSEEQYDKVKKDIMLAMTGEDMEGLSDSARFDKISSSVAEKSMTRGVQSGKVKKRRLPASNFGSASGGGDFIEGSSDLQDLAAKKNMTVDKLIAQIIAGDKDVAKMTNRPDMAAVLGGAGDLSNNLQDVSRARRDLEKQLSSTNGFSRISNIVKTGGSGLLEGGALKLALTGSDEERGDISIILGKKEWSADEEKKLAKYGINKDNAMEAKRLLSSTADMSPEKRDLAKQFSVQSLQEGKLVAKKQLKERSEVIRRMTSKGGELGSIVGGLADTMEGGELADFGQLAKSLHGMSKKQRDEFLGEAGKVGAFEITGASKAYEDEMRKKGKPADREKRALEAATREGQNAQLVAGVGETGSKFASEKEITSFFEKLTANQDTIAQMLGNIAAGKPAGENLSSSKN